MPRSRQEEAPGTAPVWAAARDTPTAEGKGKEVTVTCVTAAMVVR